MSAASEYISEVSTLYAAGDSTEYTYRTAFEQYLQTVFTKDGGYTVRHEQSTGTSNKPDFIILRGSVPVLYIEVKKPGEDLDKIEKSNQAERYFGYTNLIISDYIEFRFYRNGVRYEDPISLATVDRTMSTLIPCLGTEQHLRDVMTDFITSQKEPIKRGKHLAEIMGGKARRIRDNVVAFLETESKDKNELVRMRRFIKEHLIENFTDDDFADMYAQTLVYGLFAARYNDDTPDSFSRAEALTLVPATNPFLRSFFGHISGSSFPRRLELIVDELCEVFSHADVKALMEDYFKQMKLDGTADESPDPVIHFYEDFLREYDSSKKMDMGVFYTPLPVVRFIVRGVDELLKREFGIARGLADNERIQVKKTTQNEKGKNITETHDIHRVQLLDVAVGTGTFLNETVSHIYDSYKSQQGRWPAYVEQDLLPRLHGFELMMASYTIAHLKLAMTLKKSGVHEFGRRLGVYLSNTLDDAHDLPLTSSLFGVVDSIAQESRLASEVKNDTPIMVVLGNPPYSGESQNPHYTDNDVYKVEPGGQQKLQERNSKWINDDYVKFIRFGESLVERSGEGIVAMITAHGYVDNPTFRGMRWHLRQTFDAIYVVDLHGNSNKKETAPDGSADLNVFDIKTGVSIMFGVKKKRVGKDAADKPLATIYQADLYGKRAAKFATLDASSIESIDWNQLPADADVWKVEGKGKAEYMKGFSVAELFPVNTVGVVTSRDKFVIADSKTELAKRLEDFLELDAGQAKHNYELRENKSWTVTQAQKHQYDPNNIVPISYRPFDNRFIYYHNDFIERSRESVMKHFILGENVALCAIRINKEKTYNSVFVSTDIIDARVADRFTTSVFPLYLYENGEKIANLDPAIVAQIEAVVGATTPEDILDYVYAYLHAPSYRAQFGEFLKTDFPRVPLPASKELFSNLVGHGRHLRGLHLLTDPAVRQPITAFPNTGSDVVEKLSYKNGRVYINDEQYWDGVPEAVWKFYIGGYQPAQKYLKDRKGQKLSNSEMENYEQMIVSLHETFKVMASIDKELELWTN